MRVSSHATQTLHATPHPIITHTVSDCYVRRRPLTLASIKQAKLQLKMALSPNTVRISRLKSNTGHPCVHEASCANPCRRLSDQTSDRRRLRVAVQTAISPGLPTYQVFDKKQQNTPSISNGPLACSLDNARTSRKRLLCTCCPIVCPSIGKPGERES